MKRVAFIIILLYTLVGSALAQQPRFIFDRDSTNIEVPESSIPDPTPKAPTPRPEMNDSLLGDSLKNIPPDIPSWRIDARTGERIPVPMDTLFNGYNQQALVDGKGVAVGYLGNWGSPAQSKIFFEREETSQFPFLDAFNYYLKKPENHIFMDTKVPHSSITYWSGGGRKNKEERFIGEISMSFNKRFTLGFNIDYVYARGFYNSLATKQNNYDVFASYKTDKYQMHAFFANNNYMNLENGGLDLTNGMSSEFFNTNSKELETMFSDTWNKLRGRRLFMTHKYSIGYHEKGTEKFIPVASAFLTSNYSDQRRSFTSKVVNTLDSLYQYKETGVIIGGNNGGDASDSQNLNSSLNDYMSYWSFKNTFGISLNEGFKDWVKFGLTVFVEQDFRKYAMSDAKYPGLARNESSQNSTVIGGILSKRKGEFLRYNLSADLGVLGYNLGESRLKADIATTINIKGKQAIVRANAYIKNLKPTFFETNYFSRYYKWTDSGAKAEELEITPKSFGDIRRVYVGGEIYIPHTKTRISGGVENITNYIYYGRADSLSVVDISQEGGSLQVLSLRLDQKLNVGALHFDNQLVYQKSSNEEALPLPDLSLYSNLYLQFKVAKVLSVQLGVDAHFHTKYYAPGYDPALLRFYNQKEREIGNFPLTTAYINLHLKRTRFYLMMYNVGKDMVDTDYFNIDRYAYNPMVFKFGLSWNFTN